MGGRGNHNEEFDHLCKADPPPPRFRPQGDYCLLTYNFYHFRSLDDFADDFFFFSHIRYHAGLSK